MTKKQVKKITPQTLKGFRDLLSIKLPKKTKVGIFIKVSWEIRKSKYLFLEQIKKLIVLNKNPSKSQGGIGITK